MPTPHLPVNPTAPSPTYKQYFKCNKCNKTLYVIYDDASTPAFVLNAFKLIHSIYSPTCQYHFTNIEVFPPNYKKLIIT